MAVWVLLALGVLLLCLAEVSSDLQTELDITNVDEEASLLIRGGNRRLTQEIDYGGLCKHRCSLHSSPNRRNRACGTCCLRCKCVPPGTSGNREVCGTCYTGMNIHGNVTKCP